MADAEIQIIFVSAITLAEIEFTHLICKSRLRLRKHRLTPAMQFYSPAT